MRLFQLLVVKLLGLGVLIGGGMLVAYRFVPEIPAFTNSLIQVVRPQNYPFDMFILIPLGLALIVVGFFTLIPRIPAKGKRGHITFRGAHGDVKIDLDGIESSINKAVGKMPEVKSINLKVYPTPNGSSVQIVGDVVLFKEAGVGALATSNYVRETVEMTAQGILGVNEVTSVELNVRDVVQKRGASDKEAELLVRPRDVTHARLPGHGEVAPSARLTHDPAPAREESHYDQREEDSHTHPDNDHESSESDEKNERPSS